MGSILPKFGNWIKQPLFVVRIRIKVRVSVKVYNEMDRKMVGEKGALLKKKHKGT